MRSPSLAASLILGVLAISFFWKARLPEMTSEAGAVGPFPGSQTEMHPEDVLGRNRITHLRAGRAGRSVRLPDDVLDRSVDGTGFQLDLPDGQSAMGKIDMIRRDATGVSLVQGELASPSAGRFFFQRTHQEGVAGSLVGHVYFDNSPVGWKVEPVRARGEPMLAEVLKDRILCVDYAVPPVAVREEAPQDHPEDIPIPPYQAVIPLQSLPGATGVIYLDFDGEAGPFTGWGNFDAAPAAATNAQIHDVWKRVSEDFLSFTLNVTTDRAVFDAAPEGSRQHVVISPTKNAAPTAGGVAFVGSYNWPGDTVCWAFYSTGKTAAEAISHEVGHTLGLRHDGRISPAEDYSQGHGDGAVSWAPIMGVGYYRNLSQWSKGEYSSANNTEDDLAIIATTNNNVAYRDDDAGDSLATARHLEIAADDSVKGEGIIGRTGDVDAFRFVTSGGAVVLDLSPASASPNLDIHAELVEASTETIVATSNPDLAITATTTGTLPAGEYLLRVRGTGRGDPLVDGYTDYGSLGTYLISGSIEGGTKPDRFTLAENRPAGALVGSVAARLDHGLSMLLWSITGGNEDGAFFMDPVTGDLFASGPFDYEALSSRWDGPAEIGLFVTISDVLDPSLNETIRVVVTVTDVNEEPVIPDGSLTMLERTRVGSWLAKVQADDPDHFDFPVFSIVGGNDDGWFEIDPGTGELRVAAPIEVTSAVTVPLLVRVTDQGVPALSATATINVTVLDIADEYQTGKITRTFFEGIGGTAVSNLTASPRFPDQPDSEELLNDFRGGEHGDSYGSTVCGYVIPPETGSYRFWIAADDSGQLRLSTNSSPANVTVIASVASPTDPNTWIDDGPQQSEPVFLNAGQAYYIEARHKDGEGRDHISVAWSGPGIPKQLLRGLYLAPYYQNYQPRIRAASFPIQQDAFAGQQIGRVEVTDANAQDSHGGFTILSGNAAGIFAIDPATGVLRVAVANMLNPGIQPVHNLTIGVSDNGSPLQSGTGNITVVVLSPGEFVTTNVMQQMWSGIPGDDLASLTSSPDYPYHPTSIRTLSGLDAGVNFADDYGSRIRALVTPPVSGSYTFYLSSDEQSELLLGSGPDGGDATRIASVTGSTSPGEWDKFPSQQSHAVELVGGQQYYIEAIHKEGAGADHLQVGWTGPGIPSITIIPASALEPYDLNETPYFPEGPVSFSVPEGSPAGTVIGVVHALDPEGEVPLHAITSSPSPGAFSIDALTGEITVADSAAMSMRPGLNILTVSAQDRGIGSTYPLKTGSVAVEITVISNNQPPSFEADFFEMSATEDQPFSGAIAASDPDAADLLTFTKVSGPDWLLVATDGSFSGTPDNDDVGVNEFVIRVSDPEGLSDEAVLVITVENVNDAPVFASHLIIAARGKEGVAYTTPDITGSAVDPDRLDVPYYSIVSGPTWLELSPDGVFSGTPPVGSSGINAFTIRATDAAGLYDEATMTVEVVASLPLPWEEMSIGSVLAGEGLGFGDAFLLSGSGSLASRNDALHLVWQPLSGDGTITARLDSVGNIGSEGIAGLMIRDSLASNSRHVFIGVTGDGGYRWIRRTTTNGNTSNSPSGTGATPDVWLRLIRRDNTVTALKSADGVEWTSVGSLSAGFPVTCYFGLAVAGGSTDVENTAIFSHISLEP
ncbi:cadherin domain-containing protein [Luteolibacter flavescens]|uniref:Cadherin domain-containing protein n=1 Tax=Luteolibacter flavescens TaxID=1859460 RepID=A0ABT3FJA4_9BACT|nr:cadherin domain-containing protein [Luteolibacter flavescens]MCW1883650.1 cadherin domain-containing protein [Luteolibacter flavescens]